MKVGALAAAFSYVTFTMHCDNYIRPRETVLPEYFRENLILNGNNHTTFGTRVGFPLLLLRRCEINPAFWNTLVLAVSYLCNCRYLALRKGCLLQFSWVQYGGQTWA